MLERHDFRLHKCQLQRAKLSDSGMLAIGQMQRRLIH